MDFGCGNGFYSAEAAYQGAAVSAIDIVDNAYLTGPVGLGHIEHQKIAPGQSLPYPDGTVDKILMSEVLMVIPDAASVFVDFFRLLRPGGLFFCLNAYGRFQIRRAYAQNTLPIRLLRRYGKRTPDNYESFIANILATDVTQRRAFVKVEDIEQKIRSAGFDAVRTVTCCRGMGFSLLYWIQYIGFCFGRTYAVKYSMFLLFLMTFLNKVWPTPDDSVSLIIARKP